MIFVFLQISHIRNQHKIHVYGTDVPEPVCTFEDLEARFGINPQVIKNIQAVGYQTPTPIQIQAIPAMCEVGIDFTICHVVHTKFPSLVAKSPCCHSPLFKQISEKILEYMYLKKDNISKSFRNLARKL